MKIALICPSNMLYMPYVENYTNILNEIGIDFDIINWDRFKIEKEREFTYRDSKIGHQRNFLDYFKYSRFVLNILKKNDYNKVIVFGIQLAFFLKKNLIKVYSNKYIIDIRDYNKIIKYFNIKNVIENSTFTVISSPGYREWLPKSNKYVINHNTKIENLDELRDIKPFYLSNCNKISVSYIGALRDYKINLKFIESLKDSNIIKLNFHGEGDINFTKNILRYILEHGIGNIKLTGRYKKEQESELYEKSDFINILIPNDSINSRTLLPNRLYNAVIYGKPVIVFGGTYLAKIVAEYQLGLVINSFDNVEETVINYISCMNLYNYDRNRRTFLENILVENNLFKIRLIKFFDI